MLEYNKPLEIKDTKGNVRFTIKDLTLDTELELDLLFNEYINVANEVAKQKGINEDEVKMYEIIKALGRERVKEIGMFLRQNIKELENASLVECATEGYNISFSLQLFRMEIKKKLSE